MVGEHRKRFPDFDSIAGFYGTVAWIGLGTVSICGDHTGVYKAYIGFLAVFFLIIGNSSIHPGVQISLLVIVKPQHTDIHDQPPAHLTWLELMF
jgi:hypothetical protein